MAAQDIDRAARPDFDDIRRHYLNQREVLRQTPAWQLAEIKTAWQGRNGDRRRPNPVEAFEMVFAFDFERYMNRVGFTGTGNMFLWRKVFDAVGPFRNGVAEDMASSFRARPNLPARLCRGLDRRTSRTENVVRTHGAMEADGAGRIYA
jgi:hypothetical protein